MDWRGERGGGRRLEGSRDGAEVRALASYQCYPGSIPGPDVICGLSLLLVFILGPNVFFPGSTVFFAPQKQTFQILIRSNARTL